MKTIQIKKMVLTNFKGLRNQEVIFDKKYIFTETMELVKPHSSMLYLDAFGKDSTDRKDFEIKTLDQYNVVIPKNNEVSAVMLVDDVEIVSRILKENC
jgi:hypothetical protein